MAPESMGWEAQKQRYVWEGGRGASMGVRWRGESMLLG